MYLHKKILVSESHYRSRTWINAIHDICNIEWISLLRSESDYIKLKFPNINIYDLHDSLMHDDLISFNQKIIFLTDAESKYNFKYNNIIQTDRNLSLRNSEERINYLYYITNKLEEVLFLSKPDALFMEITWTHELILEKICNYLNIPIFCPVKCKIIKNRFFIFKSSKYSDIYKNYNNLCGHQLAHTAITQIHNNIKPQYYEYFNNRSKITKDKFLTLYRIFFLWYSGKSNKYVQINPFRSLVNKIQAIIVLNSVKYIFKTVKSDQINYKFIFLTLHVQPEASIDVAAQSYTNQIEVIRFLSKTTPIDYRILVKDHSHAVGRRNFNFYNQIAAIPNVILANIDEDSLSFIKKSSLVISITGTSSLEAAILGIPSLNIEKMYYHKVLTREKFDPFTESISDVLQSIAVNENRDLAAIAKDALTEIQSYSLKGNTGDYHTDLSVLSIENIYNLKTSLYNFMDSFFKDNQLNKIKN